MITYAGEPFSAMVYRDGRPIRWLNQTKPMPPGAVFHVNRNLRIGLVLGVLQFMVYFSGYDHMVRVGPFVTHHFLELPAFFFIGSGFSEFFHDLGWSSARSQVVGLLIYVSNILVTTYWLSVVSVAAAFIVSSPYLAGFTHHHVTRRAAATAGAS